MDKKKVLWSLLALLIAVISIRAVLMQDGTMSLAETFLYLEHARHEYVILAIASMCGYFYFEGLALHRMAQTFGYSSKKHGIVYGAADVFFSAITPSASGGQPASAYFMIRDGIPAHATTAFLLLNLVMYTLSLLVMGWCSVILNFEMLESYSLLSKMLIGFGSLVMTTLGICFYLLLRKGHIIFSVCDWFLRFLEKTRLIKEGECLRSKLKHTMEEYQKCSNMIAGHRKLLIEAVICNLLQRISQLIVPSLIYLSAGFSFSTALKVWHIQNFTVLGSNCIPIPGAMGVADYLMLDGYTILLGADGNAAQMEILCRSFSFYACIIMSGIIILIEYLAHKSKEK